jgi:hypothetical protein
LTRQLAIANSNVRDLERVNESEAAAKVVCFTFICSRDLSVLQAQASEELMSLQAQISSLLTQQHKENKPSIDLESVDHLKKIVIERFKCQKELEVLQNNELKKEELAKKIDSSRNKTLVAVWKAELKALKCSSDVATRLDSDVASLETIESLAKELIQQFVKLEAEFLDELDWESSMLCEVDRLNLMNFLQHFEIYLPDHPPPPNTDTNTDRDSDRERDLKKKVEEDILILQKELSALKEENVILQSNLIHKDRAIKDFEAIIARSRRKDGIGSEVIIHLLFII